MKIKLIAILIGFIFVIASCRKKQCPAYGSIDKASENVNAKV